MALFNIVCGICSVVGLLVSFFAATQVIKISKTLIMEIRILVLEFQIKLKEVL